ncbi:MAG: hypothetical protein V4485_04310 [Pseudomonadota bacterium]
MTNQQRTEAIILLYPSKDKTTKELRRSVSDFCIQNDIIPTDTISPSDEHDYFAMRRLAQILTHRTKPIKLITNKDVISIIPLLALWSILDRSTSTKPIDLMYNFIDGLKDDSSNINNQNQEDFRVLDHKEVGHMSDWLNDMRYAVTRDNRDKTQPS